MSRSRRKHPPVTSIVVFWYCDCPSRFHPKNAPLVNAGRMATLHEQLYTKLSASCPRHGPRGHAAPARQRYTGRATRQQRREVRHAVLQRRLRAHPHLCSADLIYLAGGVMEEVVKYQVRLFKKSTRVGSGHGGTPPLWATTSASRMTTSMAAMVSFLPLPHHRADLLYCLCLVQATATFRWRNRNLCTETQSW